MTAHPSPIASVSQEQVANRARTPARPSAAARHRRGREAVERRQALQEERQAGGERRQEHDDAQGHRPRRGTSSIGSHARARTPGAARRPRRSACRPRVTASSSASACCLPNTSAPASATDDPKARSSPGPRRDAALAATEVQAAGYSHLKGNDGARVASGAPPPSRAEGARTPFTGSATRIPLVAVVRSSATLQHRYEMPMHSAWGSLQPHLHVASRATMRRPEEEGEHRRGQAEASGQDHQRRDAEWANFVTALPDPKMTLQ